MTLPDREQDFNRRLQELEKTLQTTRENNEKKLFQIKKAYINTYSKLNKTQIKQIEGLNLDMAKRVMDYQSSLRQKYVEKYKKDEISNEALEKKIARDVQNFIYLEKQRNRAKERTEEMQQIFDIKNAAVQADLEIYNKKLALIKEQRKLTDEDIAVRKKQNLVDLRSGKKTQEEYKKTNKQLKAEAKAARVKEAKELREAGASELEIMSETGKLTGAAVKEAVFSKETASAIGNNLINGIKQMFDSTIQTYGQYQQKVNVRLQGSGNSWQGNGAAGFFTGSVYTGGIENRLKNIIGTTPYVKLQQVMDNVVKATEAGIATNVEQRAFLATISESIAATFDSFDSNLMRIIRLQQADTTAARLGLEAGLTTFFNQNFGDNSYLNSAFDTVSQNLIEAISASNSKYAAEEGVALEYTVQKWLGSLYSVGFSDTAVGKISEALGYLGSGNISALAGSDMQNLIVMAASKANMSYADLLINGLDSSNTNKLLKSMVEYLGEIAESDNKVVKSEYAKIFGMTISDLKAVTNLQDDLNTITQSVMGYGESMSELYRQMGELDSRISIAGKMQNLFDNVNYAMGTSIASNPVTYALWQITSMVEDLTGGIALPTISILGNMVDLNTTVTNLMRAGIVGVSSLGAIGSMISGIGSTFDPASMLSKLDIRNQGYANKYSSRGSGLGRNKRQLRGQSSSTYVGNASGEDYYESSVTSANEEVDKTIEQKQLESTDVNLNDIHEYLLSVFDPKITEIEKLVALMAGYSTKEGSWGEFNSNYNKGSIYRGTTVDVVYSAGNNNQDTGNLLETIKNNTTTIVELLNSVIDGTSSFATRDGDMFKNLPLTPGASNS